MSTRPRTPGHGAPAPGKLPITDLLGMKESRSPIAMITAYDAPSGRLADAAGADVILVGDSAAMTVLGHDSTVPATMEEMLVLTRAVTRGARRPLIVADMPFGSFQVSDELAVTNAIRFVKDAGADAVKLEGAGTMLSRVHAIVGAGVPVMGHIGLTPQSATALGGFKAQGRTAAKAAQLVRDALALEAAGCFALVLEAVPSPVAARITELARDPDDRDRRRCRCRRPGARLARPARPVRRTRAAVREAVRAARDRDPAGGRGVRRRRSGAPLPGGGPHLRDAGRGARGLRGRAAGAPPVRLAGQSADGTTANAATITAASPSAPDHAAPGQLERRPQADRQQRERPQRERQPDRDRRRARPVPSSEPPVRNQSLPNASTIAGNVTTIERANGSAANPTS